MDVIEYLKQQGFNFVERFNSAHTSHFKFVDDKGVSLIITMLGHRPIVFTLDDKHFDSLKEAINYYKGGDK